jgi:hypothetical protein
MSTREEQKGRLPLDFSTYKRYLIELLMAPLKLLASEFRHFEHSGDQLNVYMREEEVLIWSIFFWLFEFLNEAVTRFQKIFQFLLLLHHDKESNVINIELVN